jgi:hypothetical protein
MGLRRLDIVHVLIRVINKPLHPPIGAYLCLRLADALVILEVFALILYFGNCRMGVTRAGILLVVPGRKRLFGQVLQDLQAIIIRR